MDSLEGMTYTYKGDKNTLTAIIIPEGTTSIGEGAFENCPNLSTIIIPNTVVNIEENAFKYCAMLSSISIPSGVSCIGESAFLHCANLSSLSIPEGVTTIQGYAFCGCKGLRTITLPDTVTTLSEGSFFGCIGLQSIIIPPNVEVIDYDCFSDCTNLKSAIILSEKVKLCRGAFGNCMELTSLVIFATAVDNSEEYVFWGCDILASITCMYHSDIYGIILYDKEQENRCPSNKEYLRDRKSGIDLDEASYIACDLDTVPKMEYLLWLFAVDDSLYDSIDDWYGPHSLLVTAYLFAGCRYTLESYWNV